MPTTKNRTYWPTTGGALAFQPGWFSGHQTAMIYVNIGFGNEGPADNPDLQGPPNMSHPLIPPFQILGPTKNPYPGTVCLPQVPMAADVHPKPGDLATIQLVELAVHGAALYSVCFVPSDSLGALCFQDDSALTDVCSVFLVRRYHLRRARRPEDRACQRDQLLQQHRYRLR
jgi:hypothetical protein